MREINSHVVNPANDKIKITVLDEPGHGGACHVYGIRGLELTRNEAAMGTEDDRPDGEVSIVFQCGPIAEHGVNGITHEALLAIVADRLDSFQKGPFACQENEDALRHVESALGTLLERTKARMARNVEGTSVV